MGNQHCFEKENVLDESLAFQKASLNTKFVHNSREQIYNFIKNATENSNIDEISNICHTYSQIRLILIARSDLKHLFKQIAKNRCVTFKDFADYIYFYPESRFESYDYMKATCSTVDEIKKLCEIYPEKSREIFESEILSNVKYANNTELLFWLASTFKENDYLFYPLLLSIYNIDSIYIKDIHVDQYIEIIKIFPQQKKLVINEAVDEFTQKLPYEHDVRILEKMSNHCRNKTHEKCQLCNKYLISFLQIFEEHNEDNLTDNVTHDITVAEIDREINDIENEIKIFEEKIESDEKKQKENLPNENIIDFIEF